MVVGRYTTVHHMEILAIEICARGALERQHRVQRIHILSSGCSKDFSISSDNSKTSLRLPKKPKNPGQTQ